MFTYRIYKREHKKKKLTKLFDRVPSPSREFIRTVFVWFQFVFVSWFSRFGFSFNFFVAIFVCFDSSAVKKSVVHYRALKFQFAAHRTKDKGFKSEDASVGHWLATTCIYPQRRYFFYGLIWFCQANKNKVSPKSRFLIYHLETRLVFLQET